MTDAQILTIGITVLTILMASLFNNNRIGDVKETLRAEQATLRAEMKASAAEQALRIAELKHMIESLSMELKTFTAHFDDRLTRLERRF